MNQIGNIASTATCVFAHQWQSRARLISSATLDVFAAKFFRDIQRQAGLLDRFSRGTGTSLKRAIEGYRVRFVRTGRDNGIDVDHAGQLITVNRDYFDSIADRALAAASSPPGAGGLEVRRLLRALMRSIVRMVVGHELFHPEQGLTTITVVRQAAGVIGWDEVSKLDVDADFRAAAVEATLAALDEGLQSYQAVLARFEDALAFQLRYCVPTFGCPPDKLHKRKRAAGIAFQLARAAYWNRSGAPITEAKFRAVTMPVYVNVDPEYSRIGISGLDPIQYLGGATLGLGQLKPFFDALDSGDVEYLVQEAITLNMQIGLLPV